MKLGTINTLREALAGRNEDGSFNVGRTYASKLKHAAGFSGDGKFDVEAVVQWRKDHPNWKQAGHKKQPITQCK